MPGLAEHLFGRYMSTWDADLIMRHECTSEEWQSVRHEEAHKSLSDYCCARQALMQNLWPDHSALHYKAGDTTLQSCTAQWEASQDSNEAVGPNCQTKLSCMKICTAHTPDPKKIVICQIMLCDFQDAPAISHEVEMKSVARVSMFKGTSLSSSNVAKHLP